MRGCEQTPLHHRISQSTSPEVDRRNLCQRTCQCYSPFLLQIMALVKQGNCRSLGVLIFQYLNTMGVRDMVFIATFNNISAISWWSVLLVTVQSTTMVPWTQWTLIGTKLNLLVTKQVRVKYNGISIINLNFGPQENWTS